MRFRRIYYLMMAVFCALAGEASAQEAVVHVQFIDDATKELFATANMPADKLPDGFAVNAVLNIKGRKWTVVSANPASKVEFLKTGNLTLMMASAEKGEAAGPADGEVRTLFAMPSISGGIGRAAGMMPEGPEILSIRRNDWRQVEFVSTDYAKAVDEELADIQDVLSKGVPGRGFPELFVRQRITGPAKGCSLKDVELLLPPLKRFQGLGFQKERGLVPQSFAWAIDHSLMLWGLTDEQGNVTVLCLAGKPEKESIPTLSDALAKLTLKDDLMLVDWCHEVKLHGDLPGFEKYFGGN